MSMKVPYTYLWLREDGTPYYVGKGTGSRGFYSSAHFVNCPPDEARIVIQEWDSEQEAFDAERLLIACYGRKDLGTGCLRNRTDGGENPPKMFGNKHRVGKTPHNKGKITPAEVRLKLSKSHLNVPLSDEHRRSMSEARQAWLVSHSVSKDTCRKISEAKKGSRYRNTKITNAPLGTAWCSGHRGYASVGNFHSNKRKPNGYASYCKTCRSLKEAHTPRKKAVAACH